LQKKTQFKIRIKKFKRTSMGHIQNLSSSKLKGAPNEKFLSKEVDFSSHMAWRTPPPSPNNPRGVALNSNGMHAQGH
jgi:hypothetical protein